MEQDIITIKCLVNNYKALVLVNVAGMIIPIAVMKIKINMDNMQYRPGLCHVSAIQQDW